MSHLSSLKSTLSSLTDVENTAPTVTETRDVIAKSSMCKVRGEEGGEGFESFSRVKEEKESGEQTRRERHRYRRDIKDETIETTSVHFEGGTLFGKSMIESMNVAVALGEARGLRREESRGFSNDKVDLSLCW